MPICRQCEIEKENDEFYMYGKYIGKDCKECVKKNSLNRSKAFIPPKQGYLYAIRNPYTGMVKIGFAKDVKNRMDNYLSHAGHQMELLACWKGNTTDEIEIHKQMKNYSIVREWFYDNPIFRQLVQDHVLDDPSIK